MRKQLFLYSIMACVALAATEKTVPVIDFKNLKFLQKNEGISVKDAVDRGAFYQLRALIPYQNAKQSVDIFVSKDKKYVFLGSGFIDKTGQKLKNPSELEEEKIETAKKKEEAKKNAVILADSINHAAFKVGSGERKFYIFTDPECPYCKQMEKEIAKVTGATLYVFFFPLDFHPNAKKISLFAMTAQDPLQTLLKMDKKDYENFTPTQELEAKLAKQMEIARKLKINGTPTVFSENGEQIPWPLLINTLKGGENAN